MNRVWTVSQSVWLCN